MNSWNYAEWLFIESSQIGGGYPEPDLANLTLAWMAVSTPRRIQSCYPDCNDRHKLVTPCTLTPTTLDPCWRRYSPGASSLRMSAYHEFPHCLCITDSIGSSITGVFKLAETIQRQLPTKTGFPTHESIHESVLEQKDLIPGLVEILEANASLVCKLMPLEEELRTNWKVTGKKDTVCIQRLSAAIEAMHSPKQLASDPNKADTAHEASGTGIFGSWLVGTSIAALSGGFL